MSNNNSNDTPTSQGIIDLNSYKLSEEAKKEVDDMPIEDKRAYYLDLGKGELLESLNYCKGFIAIIFDEEDDYAPKTLFAGSMEPITTIGVMELVKQNFIAETIYAATSHVDNMEP